jgi:hypothetical protein
VNAAKVCVFRPVLEIVTVAAVDHESLVVVRVRILYSDG